MTNTKKYMIFGNSNYTYHNQLQMVTYYCTINVDDKNNGSLDFKIGEDIEQKVKNNDLDRYSHDDTPPKLKYNDIKLFLDSKNIKLNWINIVRLYYNCFEHDRYSDIGKNNSFKDSNFKQNEVNIILPQKI